MLEIVKRLLFGSALKESKTDLEVKFIIEVFEYLGRNLGGNEYLENGVFVLPNDFYFPVERQSRDRVTQIFNLAKRYIGIEDWACELVEWNDPLANWDDDLPILRRGNLAVGGISIVEGEAANIYYSPQIKNDETALVATFAHELSHYVLFTFNELGPGGHEYSEIVADIAAIYFGFGVFSLNSAFRINHDSHGWTASRTGYISETLILKTLALFLILKNIHPVEVERYVSRRHSGILKDMMAKIRSQSNLIAR